MATTKVDKPLEEIAALYKEYYRGAPFTVVIDKPVDLKQAVNTNKAVIHFL